MCDVARYESTKITKLLAQQENTDLENVEETGLSLATVKRKNCLRLYLISQEGNEWLKEHHFQAWTFVRDFETRHLPSNLLSKVVLVRVYETQNDAVGESIKTALLTVNIHKDRWLNQPEECVKLIGSKVWLNENQNADVPDGNLSQSGSPPSDGPLTQHTAPPTEYSTTGPPPSQEPRELSVVPNVGSDNAVVGALKVLTDEIKVIRIAAEHIAGNTGRTADNTEGLSEAVTETRDVAFAIGNHVQEGMVDSQASDND